MPIALLINPWIYDFSAFDLWASPLGLLNLAALLQQAGWDVRYVDCTDRFHPAVAHLLPAERSFHVGKYLATEVPKPEPLRWVPRKYKRYGLLPETVEQDLLDGLAPDVVLVTSRMTYWYPGVADVIGLCRRLFPSAPILLGGTYATLCPDHARAVCGPDIVFEGEAEAHLAGLIERATGRRVPLPAALRGADLHDLESLPRPAYRLLRQTRALPYETSRGCPYRCTYCSSRILSPGFRRKSPGKVVDEIEWMAGELGTEDIAFYDDALLMDSANHFEPIADAIVKRNIKIRFHTPNSLFASRLTPGVAGKMKAIGVETVRISLESVSETRLKALNRRVYPQHFADAMANLRAAGFARDQIGVYLLCGLPGQTVDEVRDAIDFVIDQGAVPRLAEFSPIPRTDEWPAAVAASPLPIDAEPLLHNNTVFHRISGPLRSKDLEALKNYAWTRIRRQTPP